MTISHNCVMNDVTLTCKSFRNRQLLPSNTSLSILRRRRSRYCSRIVRALP